MTKVFARFWHSVIVKILLISYLTKFLPKYMEYLIQLLQFALRTNFQSAINSIKQVELKIYYSLIVKFAIMPLQLLDRHKSV